MASTFKPHIQAYKSDGGITKGMALKFGSDDLHLAPAADDGKVVAIAQNDAPNAEDVIEAAVRGGGAKAKAGGTITRGDWLASDANSALITSETNTGAGQAYQSAVVGDIFEISF